MVRMMRGQRLGVWVCCLIVFTLSACRADTRPSSHGPFVDRDPAGIVEDIYWVDPTGQTPALPVPLPEDVAPVLIEASGPYLLRIAVNGNGCVPETHLIALGVPGVGIDLEVFVTEAIPEPGLNCADILTTHAFEVRLSEPFRNTQVLIVSPE